MTTLTDIHILTVTAERAAERYNRRCRRMLALYRAGRKPNESCWNNTEAMRKTAEAARKDLDTAIMEQAMIASMAQVNI